MTFHIEPTRTEFRPRKLAHRPHHPKQDLSLLGLVCCMDCPSILNMTAICCSEALGFVWSTRLYDPDGGLPIWNWAPKKFSGTTDYVEVIRNCRL
jgi:hypothetical protein